MVPKSSDPETKTVDALARLQQALYSISEALKIIAESIPSLLPSTKDSVAHQPHTSETSDTNQPELAIAAPSSNKRKRKEKDPDAPEKPSSAYHLYAKEKREQIKAEMGGTPTGNDILHELNRQWKELSDELKKVCSVVIHMTNGAAVYRCC